eukprot:PITA_33246
MRIVVVIAAQHKWKVYQMEIKSTFLNGVLKEEAYVAQPPGYEVEGKEDKVYRLRKALYGLKQSPCAWYNKIDAYLLDNGFDKCDVNPLSSSKRAMYGVLYTTTSDFRFVGYTDSDWARSFDDRKSMSRHVFHYGSGAISWASRKQPIVSLSTAEVEYVVATIEVCQAIWMRRMLRDLRHDQEGTTTIFCDNTSTIAMSNNSIFHKRTKHIDVKYHFIRELIDNDEIMLQHCKSQEQFTDIFIKPLACESFVYLINNLGIVNGGNCD